MASEPLLAYLRMAIRELERTHAPEVLAVIQPGQLGCCSCGHVADRSAFAETRRGQRCTLPARHVCPACGRVVEEWGYADGDDLARLRAARKPGVNGARPKAPSDLHDSSPAQTESLHG